jgi:hypothetical protein
MDNEQGLTEVIFAALFFRQGAVPLVQLPSLQKENLPQI